MDNTKFIALMSDNNADFNIIVSKDNLKAFADHLINHFRLELETKAGTMDEYRRIAFFNHLIFRKKLAAI